MLELYPGVTDIRKGFGREMPQISFEIKPAGQALGITARDLGQQIRNSFTERKLFASHAIGTSFV